MRASVLVAGAGTGNEKFGSNPGRGATLRACYSNHGARLVENDTAALRSLENDLGNKSLAPAPSGSGRPACRAKTAASLDYLSTRFSMKNSIMRSRFKEVWPRSGPTCTSKLFFARDRKSVV